MNDDINKAHTDHPTWTNLPSADLEALRAVAEAADALIRTGDRKYEKDLAVALSLVAARQVPIR